MFNLQSVIVADAGPLSLSLSEFLLSLKRRGHLSSLILQALADKQISAAARAAGLAVSTAELQHAADKFRRRQGLARADRTQAWLNLQGLTIADFEANLERELLEAKLRRHLTEPLLTAHFEQHREHYATARLRQIVVSCEAEARELLVQMTGEGRDFAGLARDHSTHLASRGTGGSLGNQMRCTLPPAFADSIFAAQAGAIVGPLSSAQGFHLIAVEELCPPVLDEATVALVRKHLFEAWLRQRLESVRADWTWLHPSTS